MSNQSRYILSKRIARGGMAEIFLGKAVGSDDFERICAIKRILPHHAQEKEFVEMFRTEAGICKRLQHANIVQVYDFKKVDGNYAIIMEFVNGTDLRSLLAACEKARIKLSIPMVVYIGSHVARGLHYAHTKVDDISRKPLGIVHRDISPQNILISYDGEVKVIDFGIANYEAKSMETKPGVVKGKYSYMSPEQVSAKALDARTDVFSLAIVLWEALAMRRLFAADTEVETIRNVQNCIIKSSLKESNPNVDDELLAIMNKALEKDRKTRYQSAAAFEKDLLKYLNSKFPEFNSSDLGTFLKQLLSGKRNEMQEDIKKLLSMPSNIVEEAPTENAESIGSAPKTADSAAFGTNAQKSSTGSSKSLSSKGNVLIMDDSKNANTPQFLLSRNVPPSQNLSPTRTTQTRNTISLGNLRSYQPTQASSMPRFANNTNVNKRKPSRVLPMFGAAAIVIAVTFGWMQFKTSNVKARKDIIEFHLKTIPANVILAIDGKPMAIDGKYMDPGEYTRTPIKLELPVGEHKLTLSRDGYISRVFTVNGEGGEVFREDNVVLELDKRVRMASVIIKTNRDQKVYVEINQGFFRDFIPSAIIDLQLGKSHELIAYPNYPTKKGGFKCNFVPKSTSFTTPFTLTLDVGTNGRRPQCIVNSR